MTDPPPLPQPEPPNPEQPWYQSHVPLWLILILVVAMLALHVFVFWFLNLPITFVPVTIFFFFFLFLFFNLPITIASVAILVFNYECSAMIGGILGKYTKGRKLLGTVLGLIMGPIYWIGILVILVMEDYRRIDKPKPELRWGPYTILTWMMIVFAVVMLALHVAWILILPITFATAAILVFYFEGSAIIGGIIGEYAKGRKLLGTVLGLTMGPLGWGFFLLTEDPDSRKTDKPKPELHWGPFTILTWIIIGFAVLMLALYVAWFKGASDIFLSVMGTVFFSGSGAMIGTMLGEHLKDRQLLGAVLGLIFGPLGWGFLLLMEDHRKICGVCGARNFQDAPYCTNCRRFFQNPIPEPPPLPK